MISFPRKNRWMPVLFILFLTPFCYSSWLDELKSNDGNGKWEGKWFPTPPDAQVDTNPKVKPEQLYDAKHGVKMGVASSGCDDAKTNLEVDWLDDPTNYTCYENKELYLPDENVRPIFSEEHIPKGYSALHKCMRDVITYDHYIPTFGTHRPLWGVYGEYKFLPRQRWLHNLEHGGIALLYHPCANPYEVNYLRTIVTSCLYRHVITPYNLLTQERPLALVAWGKRLEMSKVDPHLVVKFITSFAKHGPEHTYKNGQYNYGLIKGSVPPVDKADSTLCSKLSNAIMN